MSLDLPELIAVEPTTRPAVTYDRYWVQTIVVRCPSPAEKAVATAVLARCSSSDGSLSGETVSITVEDLFARAAGNEQIATAMHSLMVAIQQLACAEGLVSQ